VIKLIEVEKRYEGGFKIFRPEQLYKVTEIKTNLLFFNIVSLDFNTYWYWYINLTIDGAIQGVSRLVDITAGGDFLGLCGQKVSYKHVSDFGLLRGYDRLKLRIEGNDYWQ